MGSLRKSVALALMSIFMPRRTPAPVIEPNAKAPVTKAGKGQLRQARPNPSGAAQNQRAAKKRANIRKHK